MDSLLGVWIDANSHTVFEPKRYVVQSGLHIDIYSQQSGEWLFGGSHLMHLRSDGAMWGSIEIKYFCTFSDIIKTKEVRWFPVHGQSRKPRWIWRRPPSLSSHPSPPPKARLSVTCATSPPIRRSPPVEAPPQPPRLLVITRQALGLRATLNMIIGANVYTESEYDPDKWLPAVLVDVTIDDFVVSTQDGSHKWSVYKLCLA